MAGAADSSEGDIGGVLSNDSWPSPLSKWFRWNRVYVRTYPLLLIGRLLQWLPESRCYRLKVFLYNLCGQSIHPTARLYSSVRFATYPVTIGARSHVGAECLFTGGIGCPIEVGDDCDIGSAVVFLTGTHAIGPSRRRAGEGKAFPIKVGSGTWIGARALILPGVVIGEGCIVAAGSVVTSDVPANVMVAGVPAIVKKDLPVDLTDRARS